MKSLTMLVIACCLILCGTASSFGLQIIAPYTNEYNFSGTDTLDGRDYLEVSDDNTSPFFYVFNHDVTFDPLADFINSAQITLSHHNNSDNSGEVWFLYQGTSTAIGELSNSTGSDWVDQEFILPSSLYSSVSGGSWSLGLSLKETTTGTDKIQLDKSVLSGLYTYTQQDNGGGGLPGDDGSGAPPQGTQVPEPGTIALVGLGLAAIGLYRRGRRD